MSCEQADRRRTIRRCPLALVVGVALAGSGCRRADKPYAGFVDAPVAAVAAQSAGKVWAVHVHAGERAHRGQLLAELDARDKEAAVAEAQANVERSTESLREAEKNLEATLPTVRSAGADIAHEEAAVADARLTYQRMERLVASGAAAQSQLDSARAQLLQARATLAARLASKEATHGRVGAAAAATANARAALHSSEAALRLAEVQLDQARIRSPFEGLVVEENLYPGEWAAPGTPVVTVEDLSRPWVRIDVEETRFSYLAIAERAQIRVIALGGRTFSGHVIEIGAEGEFAINRDVKRGRPDIRTFRVRVAFDQLAEELRPGMTAEVTLQPTAGRSR